jgi:hypothetical protein
MEAETTTAASNVAGSGAAQKTQQQAPEGHSVTKRLQSELMQLMVS